MWTIVFELKHMANIEAKEHEYQKSGNQKENSIEISFDYTIAPNGFDTTKNRDIEAREIKAGEEDTSGDDVEALH